jgi:hypothetical protein
MRCLARRHWRSQRRVGDPTEDRSGLARDAARAISSSQDRSDCEFPVRPLRQDLRMLRWAAATTAGTATPVRLRRVGRPGQVASRPGIGARGRSGAHPGSAGGYAFVAHPEGTYWVARRCRRGIARVGWCHRGADGCPPGLIEIPGGHPGQSGLRGVIYVIPQPLIHSRPARLDPCSGGRDADRPTKEHPKVTTDRWLRGARGTPGRTGGGGPDPKFLPRAQG